MELYRVQSDIKIIQELLGLSVEQLASDIGVSPMTVFRWKKNERQITAGHLATLYDYVFQKGILLNEIKSQLYLEEYANKENRILFHGAKTGIQGKLALQKSRSNNDFGPGFYCGESMEQAAMFVADYPESSLYIVQFQKTGLRAKNFDVSTDWMLAIAAYRNRLGEYKNSKKIQAILRQCARADYIIAPIADNRMFALIDHFISGELTDIQCQHCLSATNLGKQYVFTTEKALKQVRVLRRCYLAPHEKRAYLQTQKVESKTGEDKVRIAKRMYRGKGKYIEELLS